MPRHFTLEDRRRFWELRHLITNEPFLKYIAPDGEATFEHKGPVVSNQLREEVKKQLSTPVEPEELRCECRIPPVSRTSIRALHPNKDYRYCAKCWLEGKKAAKLFQREDLQAALAYLKEKFTRIEFKTNEIKSDSQVAVAKEQRRLNDDDDEKSRLKTENARLKEENDALKEDNNKLRELLAAQNVAAQTLQGRN